MNSMLLEITKKLPWFISAIALLICGVLGALFFLAQRSEQKRKEALADTEKALTNRDKLLNETQAKIDDLEGEKQTLAAKLSEREEECKRLIERMQELDAQKENPKENPLEEKLKKAKKEAKKKKEQLYEAQETLRQTENKYYAVAAQKTVLHRYILQVQLILDDIEGAKNPEYIAQGIRKATEKIEKCFEEMDKDEGE